jgi:hypothetical protein
MTLGPPYANIIGVLTSECGVYLQGVYEIIDLTCMQIAEVTIEDWPLLDCQEYIMDLEISAAKVMAMAALEQIKCGKTERRREQSWNLRPRNRERALELRRRHLELQLGPAAT